MHHAAEFNALDYLHLTLAMIIAGAYLSIPFTALIKLRDYIPRPARLFAVGFFLTCAVTHIALAAGFHDSHWMVINDLVQAVSSTGFIVSLHRMVAAVMRRRAARLAGVASDDDAT